MVGNNPLVDKWAAEYAQGGIPSSVRETPSGAVVWAADELKRQGYAFRNVLDLGCGKGRNSLYLAEKGAHVTAFDFTPDAIEHLQTTAAERGLTLQIRALVQDVTEDWPLAPGSMELIIDAFCFKHIAPREGRLAYRNNLMRALRVHGHYMISFASIGDGYYGRYVVEDRGGEEQVVVDPVNGVESVLYSRDAALKFFYPELIPLAELQNNEPSVMHGEEYKRSTYALLLRRNPKLV